MLYHIFPGRPELHETQRRGENTFPALSSLHRSCDEALPVSHALDVVEDRDFAVPCEHEVAVHGVDGEVGGDGGLSGREALRDGGAAEDTASAGRVPEGAGVGVDVGADVG